MGFLLKVNKERKIENMEWSCGRERFEQEGEIFALASFWTTFVGLDYKKYTN